MKWFVLPLHQFPGRTLVLSITTTQFSNSIRSNRIENSIHASEQSIEDEQGIEELCR